jgi:DNA (cytosine-5)-methyltransferase 1
MNYLSVCSGIEAATVAWHPLDWNPVGFSEIESFPSQVLKHHYPTVPNLGDMTKFKEWEIESNIDVFVGGTPCQSFSVAGLRKGLDDPRGNLMLTYLAIADKFRPRWLVWENVPGVLSSNGGKDFGTFLGGLGELGYGFAYRILDAQYFGVAQRRRRVFVVGYLGDWRPAAAVLFERNSLQGNPAPSREKRESIAVSTRAVPEGYGIDRVEVVNALCASDSKGVGNQYLADHKCVVQPIALAENTIGRQPHNGGNGDGFTNGGPMYTLNASGVHGVAQPLSYDMKQHHNPQPSDTVQLTISNCATVRGDTPLVQPIGFESSRRDGVRLYEDITNTLQAFAGTGGGNSPMVAQPVGTDLYNGTITGDIACTFTADATSATHSGPTVMQSMAVRRLTPVECERLQGFPDHYTDIKSKGKQTPDGPRYKALGNSMAVPVMNWIGQKIQKVEDIIK